MKTETFLLLAGGAAALYYFEQMNKAADTVQFVFSGIQAHGPLSYTLQIIVQNISNVSATVNSVSGTVSINDSQVGNISDFTPVTIGPNSQQTLNINLTVSVLGLPSAVANLISTGGDGLDFTIDGNANVNGLIVPFNLDKQLSV